MIEKIIIIHPSEIIRKGLYAVIQMLCSRDIIILASLSEIRPFFKQKDLKLIIFADTNLFVQEVMTDIEKSSERVVFVKIIGRNEVKTEKDISDYYISIYSTSSDIGRIINEILEKNKNELEGHEGEELTVREKEVLKLVAAGFPNKLIADKLFISVHTVISHRKNITEKLGIKSISGLTVYAILNHLIIPSEIDFNQLT